MQVILLMVIGSVLAVALALVRNFPGFFWPESCTGTLRTINHTQPRTVDVECEDRSQQKFFIADNTAIATPTNPRAGLQDLNTGDNIKITFTRKGNACWARSIVTQR